MASLSDFFHGVETVTVDSGARPITTARSSVIALLYTAESASETAFPFHVPMLFNRRSNYAGMGSGGTGRRSLDGIFDQIGALVVGIRVPEGASDGESFANLIGGTDAVTGAYKGASAIRAAEADCGVSPMLLIAPGFTHQRPVGVTAVTMGDDGAGYTHADVAFAGGGATKQATGHAVIAGGKVTGIVLDTVGIGYTDHPIVTITGDGNGATATATVGPSSNPVAGSLLSIANSIRAHVIVDGPSTTDADAIAARGDFGSRRIFFVDPAVSGYSAAAAEYAIEPASARVAGLIARTDNEVGFWESPSNKEMVGIGGLARPIDYAFGAADSRANVLNSNEVATIIRDDAFKLWGNRTCSDDPKYAFLNISRVSDIVDISIAKAHKWAVDRGITKTYFDDVSGSVSAYLRNLKKQGAILGGECWVDPDANTADQYTAGHATFDYDFGGISPAERVTFRSQLTDRYIADLFK